MQAKKMALVPAYKKMAQPLETDYGQMILWMTWILQFAYAVGIYKKIEFLTSGLILGPILLAPAFCVLLAKSWASAAKYGLYCSFVVPLCIGILLFLIALLSFAKKHEGLTFINPIAQTVEPTLLVWGMIMFVTLPALLIGAIGKFVWHYFRRK